MPLVKGSWENDLSLIKILYVTLTMQAYGEETLMSHTMERSGKTKDVNAMAEQRTKKIVQTL